MIDMGRLLFLDSGTLTPPMLKKMEKAGCVTLENDEAQILLKTIYYGNLQMFNMPYEGKARFKAGFLCRKILEMTYQFLSGMEGIFQQPFRF